MSGMSGAPDFMGHHAGRMEGHGPDAARGRHGETHATPDGSFPLVAGFPGAYAWPVASMRGGCGDY